MVRLLSTMTRMDRAYVYRWQRGLFSSVIGHSKLPPDFVDWNKRHGAPFGRTLPLERWAKRIIPWRYCARYRSPFYLQTNNTTRYFEYPWAFHAVPVAAGHHVLEIGGGLGGFQFVLDKHGCVVTNVDPGLAAAGVGWVCDPASMKMLNRVFGTSVTLVNTVIAEADFAPNSFDRIYCISVLEHLPKDEIEDAVSRSFRILKPGGFLILTVDLFLNLAPFTSRESNSYGSNVDVAWLTGLAPFVLDKGNKEELYGFPEFDPDRIQSNLETYYVGAYPTLAQCLVLRKPVES